MKKPKLTAMQKLVNRYTTRRNNLETKLEELRAQHSQARDKLVCEINELDEVLKKIDPMK